MPWFASQSHGWYVPSFGYIIGFVVAAGIVGELARRGNDRSVLSAIGVMAIGEAVLLTIGTIWLAYDLHVSAGKAISYGVTPFLIGDAVKLAVAAIMFPGRLEARPPLSRLTGAEPTRRRSLRPGRPRGPGRRRAARRRYR